MDGKTGKFVLFGFVGLLVVAGVNNCANNMAREGEIRRQAEAAALEKARKDAEAAKAKDDAIAKFNANREAILGEIRAKVAAKKFDDARAAAAPYKDVSDPDYTALAAAAFDGWKAQEDKRKAAEKTAAEKADLAKRKKEGVRIGMSQADVLKSSWGKPNRINRSTGSYGTHEQWVYGDGNYLYFENGILKTVQN